MSDNTRNQIVEAAIELFSHKGFDNTSIKEISELAKVNISAINYHFDTKENLLNTILEDFAIISYSLAERTLQESKNKDEYILRFKMFLSHMVDSVFKNDKLKRIIDMEILRIPCRIQDIVENGYVPIIKKIIHYFELGQKHKIINSKLDPLELAIIVMTRLTTINSPFQFKNFLLDYSQSKARSNAIDNFIEVLFEGTLARK